jgi:hypothetical protein
MHNCDLLHNIYLQLKYLRDRIRIEEGLELAVGNVDNDRH